MKEAVVGVFGTGDKPFLVTLVVIGVLAIAGGAGIAEARRSGAGRAVLLVGGAVGALAAATRTGNGWFDVLPSLVAAAVGVLVLGVLTRSRLRDADAARRSVLVLGAVALLGVVAGAGATALTSGSRRVAAAIGRIRLPAPVSQAPAVPSGAALDVPRLAPLLTPNSRFYRIDVALAPPEIDPADWSLLVDGLVERPFRISYADLLALPLTESRTTLACVSNEVGGDLISTATWLGHPVRELLRRAGVRASADMVLSHGEDGFTAGTPLETLTDGRDAVLAVGMNGEVLPILHGFPARLVVPGLYGYVSATKWITRLEVTRFDRAEGYWTPRGWSVRGPVKLQSRIDVPSDGARVGAGAVTIAGVAWKQHTGVGRVQVAVDDGPWRDAELAAPISADTWRQWRYRWLATSGDHTVRVRATDARGEVQTARRQGTVPNGATGLHTIRVSVG